MVKGRRRMRGHLPHHQHPHPHAHWCAFTITHDAVNQPLGHGTKICPFLKEDWLTYVEEEKIKNVIKKHSEFISYPIHLTVTKEIEKVTCFFLDIKSLLTILCNYSYCYRHWMAWYDHLDLLYWQYGQACVRIPQTKSSIRPSPYG
jgi:hypothetical protein